MRGFLETGILRKRLLLFELSFEASEMIFPLSEKSRLSFLARSLSFDWLDNRRGAG
jgi:hypothetical protein